MKLYKAKLQTGRKTPEQIKKDFEGYTPSEEEIKGWIKAYDLIDGIEVVVMKSWTGNGYTLAFWQDEDDAKIRDYIYQIEQDEMFGTYNDQRDEFLRDWDSDEYSPTGSFVFNEEDVEIIEELRKEVGAK